MSPALASVVSRTCLCASLPDVLDGATVRGTPELGETALAVRTAETWTSVYECRLCGALWEERFEERGHGEVPSVHGLNRG